MFSEADNAKTGCVERIVDRLLDLWISSRNVKPSDSDSSSGSVTRFDGLVTSRESRLQQVHSFNEIRHIFRHRPDCIEMLGRERENAVERDQPKSGLEAKNAAAGCGNSDGTRRVRTEGDVRLIICHGYR